MRIDIDESEEVECGAIKWVETIARCNRLARMVKGEGVVSGAV
jgi:hypothetical protein